MNQALGDGFIEMSGCGANPQGAVGIEYVHLVRSSDQRVAVEEPESLLYIPAGFWAGRRLVALQYSVPVLQDGIPYQGMQPPDPERIQRPPELFGRPFEGPAPNRNSTGSWLYYLRVWPFSSNPDGAFASANPAEACEAEELVAPHVAANCHEVHGIFNVPAARVRAIGNVPAEFRIRGEDEEDPEGGTAEITILTFRCEGVVSEDGSELGDVLFTNLDVLLDPPDWSGDHRLFDRYLFRVVANNQEAIDWWRRGSRLGEDVFAYSPHLAREFNPIASKTGLTYHFTTPDFELRAQALTDPITPELPTATVRWWREAPGGMAMRSAWVPVRVGTVGHVEVTPTPGTLLAELLGCDSTTTCEPVVADQGLLDSFEHGVTTVSWQQEWWNPRHETGETNVSSISHP